MLSSRPDETKQESSPAAEEVQEPPALAPGVTFAGPTHGTGFTERPWLIEPCGRLLSLPEPLYRVAEQINGERTLEEIAKAVVDSTDWLVSAELVREIIAKKLIPLGLVRTTDRSVRSREPDRGGFGPGTLHPIARVLRYLFTPPIGIPLLIAVGVACAWLFLARGVADDIRKALRSAKRFAPRMPASHCLLGVI